jgi:hypothetical protein
MCHLENPDTANPSSRRAQCDAQSEAFADDLACKRFWKIASRPDYSKSEDRYSMVHTAMTIRTGLPIEAIAIAAIFAISWLHAGYVLLYS